MTEQATKPSAPECGLYIRINDDFGFENAVAQLRHLFFVTTRSAYEKNMHVVELPGDAENAARAEEVKGLVTLARQNGFVAIIRHNIANAAEWNADGVLLDTVNDLPAARDALGPDIIIGVNVRISRSIAERALEDGADYVVFGAAGKIQLPPADLISWWSTHTDVPCLAAGPIANDNCATFVQAGATFVDASRYILHHPQGVMQGTSDMLYAIDLAVEQNKLN